MASFNQIPSGQTSLGTEPVSLTLGSDTNSVFIQTDLIVFAVDASGIAASVNFEPVSPVLPSRRRSVKTVRGV